MTRSDVRPRSNSRRLWALMAVLSIAAASCGSSAEPTAATTETAATRAPDERAEQVPSEPDESAEQDVSEPDENPEQDATAPDEDLACDAGTSSTARWDPGVVASFDPELFENPEGVAVDSAGNVFATQANLGLLIKFTPGSEGYEIVGSIPDWQLDAVGFGFLGLAFDDHGNLFGAVQKGEVGGIYKFECAAGVGSRLEGTEAMGIANSLTFDDRGVLYATDSHTGLDGEDQLGAIWRIDQVGPAEKWIEDTLLGGTGFFGFSFPMPGANGIVFRDGELVVANTERFALYSVPVMADGTPGDITALVEGEFGPDGIALGPNDEIYVADIPNHRVMKVNTDGTVDVVGEGSDDGLDQPSSVALSPDGSTIYAVNLVLGAPEFSSGVGPALVSLEIGAG